MDEIVKSGICIEEQSSRLLCYFVHRWLDFRVPEIEALASLFGITKLVWSLPSGGSPLSPFWYLTLPSLDVLKQISNRSLLTKVCFSDDSSSFRFSQRHSSRFGVKARLMKN